MIGGSPLHLTSCANNDNGTRAILFRSLGEVPSVGYMVVFDRIKEALIMPGGSHWTVDTLQEKGVF